jgi:hypothetical protein
MIHAVKILPKFFEDVVTGRKPFEIRKNNRDYRERDYIALNEYDPTAPENERYTGQSALFRISYILDDPEYCKEEFIVMGLEGCSVHCKCAGCEYNRSSPGRVLYGNRANPEAEPDVGYYLKNLKNLERAAINESK